VSLAEVRTAWAAVFTDATIQAITRKAYNYDVLVDDQQDESELVEDEALDFFTYVTTFKKKIIGTSSQTVTEYYVEVKYYREADSAGVAYNAIADAMETLYTRVVAVLGSKWSNTIDFWIPQADAAGKVEPVIIDGRKVLTSAFVFNGIKTI